MKRSMQYSKPTTDNRKVRKSNSQLCFVRDLIELCKEVELPNEKKATQIGKNMLNTFVVLLPASDKQLLLVDREEVTHAKSLADLIQERLSRSKGNDYGSGGDDKAIIGEILFESVLQQFDIPHIYNGPHWALGLDKPRRIGDFYVPPLGSVEIKTQELYYGTGVNVLTINKDAWDRNAQSVGLPDFVVNIRIMRSSSNITRKVTDEINNRLRAEGNRSLTEPIVAEFRWIKGKDVQTLRYLRPKEKYSGYSIARNGTAYYKDFGQLHPPDWLLQRLKACTVASIESFIRNKITTEKRESWRELFFAEYNSNLANNVS